MVQQLIELGNSVAVPFLYYILSFAYIDGEIEDDVAEKLDNMFGMCLLEEFIQNSEEAVPAPQIGLTKFEADIVKWFQSDAQLGTLDEAVAYFPEKTQKEIQEVLDSLIDKEILAKVETAIGYMYVLLT